MVLPWQLSEGTGWWTPSSSSLFPKDVIDEHVQTRTVDRALFDFCIGVRYWRFVDINKDGGREPLDKVVGGCIIALGITCKAGQFLKRCDILIDVGEFHMVIFNLGVRAIPSLGILVLGMEFK